MGDDKSYMVQSFTKDRFTSIRRVTVKSGNPAARTPAFALQTADALLQRGVIGRAVG